MYFIVVGCGRLGADLAYRLSRREDTQVVAIDSDKSAFNNLPHDYDGRIVEGDAMSQETLVRAGIEHADALAAVTDSDPLNAVVGHFARVIYRVPMVVARNFDPQCRSIFEVFGLQVVSSTSWGAQRIEEMLHHGEMRAVFSAGNGEVELYEIIIPSRWNQRRLSDLVNAENYLPTSLTRAGKAFLPSPDSILETGDILHVSATMQGIELLREALGTGQEA